MRLGSIGAIAIVGVTSAHAEVVSTSDAGFVSRHSVETAASPAQVYARIGEPAKWWHGDHTFSGSAANLTIEPVAGGCFCERDRKTGRSIVHARVIHADPGKLLRMSGGLGPLQSEAVIGTIEFAIAAKPNSGSTITLTYVVGGYSRTSLSAIAKPVDFVMGQQLAGLAKALATP